jgi:hypothetical protein
VNRFNYANQKDIRGDDIQEFLLLTIYGGQLHTAADLPLSHTFSVHCMSLELLYRTDNPIKCLHPFIFSTRLPHIKKQPQKTH